MGERNDVRGREAIGQFLQALGVGALDKGIATLSESNFLLGQLPCQPFMPVDAQATIVGKVRTDAEESAAELGIVEIEVILVDETVLEVDMWLDFRLLSDGDACAFAALENDANAERLGTVLEVGVSPVLAALFL